MTVLNVSDILTHAAENGGGTYTRTFDDDFWLTVQKSDGYMVSLFGFEMKIPQNELTVWRLNEFIKNRSEKFEYAYLGIWQDGNDVYLDVSIYVKNRDTARQIAVENAQLAFWDCEKGEAIPAHTNCGGECNDPEAHRKQ
jgi:hypothetical protein